LPYGFPQQITLSKQGLLEAEFKVIAGSQIVLNPQSKIYRDMFSG